MHWPIIGLMWIHRLPSWSNIIPESGRRLGVCGQPLHVHPDEYAEQDLCPTDLLSETNAGLMLCHRRRRWPDITTASVQRVVCSGQS